MVTASVRLMPFLASPYAYIPPARFESSPLPGGPEKPDLLLCHAAAAPPGIDQPSAFHQMRHDLSPSPPRIRSLQSLSIRTIDISDRHIEPLLRGSSGFLFATARSHQQMSGLMQQDPVTIGRRQIPEGTAETDCVSVMKRVRILTLTPFMLPFRFFAESPSDRHRSPASYRINTPSFVLPQILPEMHSRQRLGYRHNPHSDTYVP